MGFPRLWTTSRKATTLPQNSARIAERIQLSLSKDHYLQDLEYPRKYNELISAIQQQNFQPQLRMGIATH